MQDFMIDDAIPWMHLRIMNWERQIHALDKLSTRWIRGNQILMQYFMIDEMQWGPFSWCTGEQTEGESAMIDGWLFLFSSFWCQIAQRTVH